LLNRNARFKRRAFCFGKEGEKIKIIPITLKTANAFVQAHHRHHGKVQGCKFCVAAEIDGTIRGVAIAGRPVARYLDDGFTAEVTRLCTDGTHNACSFLYAACARIARSMGYEKIITYILESENGASLRASGWRCEGRRGGGNWNVPSRPRQDSPNSGYKKLYIKTLK